MTRPRILLVSYLFPPYAGIGSLRIGKLAKFLREKGWDVRVLACDSGEAKSLPLEIPAADVVYTPWFEVDHALDNFIPKWYRQQPAEAVANSSGSSGAGQPSPPPEETKLRLALRNLYMEMVRWPDNRIGWLPHALRAGRALLKQWRPDVIYASAPPFTSLLVADRLSSLSGVPWIAEFRDLWLDHPYYSYSPPRRAVEQIWERRVLGRARAMVTVSPPWARLLDRKYGKPTALIMNGYVPEDFPLPPPLPPSQSGPLRIVYTGHIYEGYRDPTPLFKAMTMLGSEREDIRVEFIGTSNDTLLPLAKRCAVEDLITVRPPIPYREALRVQMEADILLHLQWNDPKEEGTISGKLFEYIAARRPILGIGYEAGSVAQIVSDHRAGFICNDPAGIAQLLRRWITEKKQGGVSPLDASAPAGLSRNEQFEKLETFLLDLPKVPPQPRGDASRDLTGMSRQPHYRRLDASRLSRPILCAIVDTEEDFDWRKPFSREDFGVASLRNLPLAQAAFRRWNVKPTYLVDYPVVTSKMGQELLSEWARNSECLVGAQLHPWVSPPHQETVSARNSYAGNLPEALERAKLETLTAEIENRCGLRPRVYKAGRYGLGFNSARILEDLGYLVDTSIIPYTDLTSEEGPNYAHFDASPFWFGQRRPLLELPVTRAFAGSLRGLAPAIFPQLDRWLPTRWAILGSLARFQAMERITLTPEGITFDEMRRLTDALLADGQRIFTFSFHSPSMLPGNTPYVRTQAELDAFFGKIDRYFNYFFETLGGMTATPLEIFEQFAPTDTKGH